jgi:hypothetical protein
MTYECYFQFKIEKDTYGSLKLNFEIEKIPIHNNPTTADRRSHANHATTTFTLA